MTQALSEKVVMATLKGVIDPELGSNIVELGIAQKATVDAAGSVNVTIALTTGGCPLRAQIQKDVKARVSSIPGVIEVKITWTEMDDKERADAMAVARKNAADKETYTSIPAATKVLAIASGKGGVGKSSVTVNLAVALAQQGMRVGLLDADIWGFSIPRLLGLDKRIEAIKVDGKAKMKPHRVEMGTGWVDAVSMGFLAENEEDALLWRGLMLNRAVQHFLQDVVWDAKLDYILIDLPPGTGDVSMGLARMLSRTEMIVVTTPALAAQKVASRAVSMARKCYLRVAGVIENMSSFADPSGQVHALFGSGGGQALADEAGVALLGQIPITPELAAGGDAGQPIAASNHETAQVFHAIAKQIVEEICPPVEMAGCSARLFEAMEDALAAQE